jgi:polyisoprenyl-phosphate glycosyltransferase
MTSNDSGPPCSNGSGPNEGGSASERPYLSVVVPVYRSTGTLAELHARIAAACQAAAPSYEIVFVNDASPDDAWRMLTDLAQKDPEHVIAIELMRNFGQHNALMCGFRHARGELIITLDDDLQNPPEAIVTMIATLQNGEFDLVYGVPEQRQHAVGRNIGSWLVNVFYRSVFRTNATLTSYRIIRRKLLEAILEYDLNFTFIDGLLAWNTQQIGEATVGHHPRSNGRSGYSLGKLLTLALNLFTNFSLLPLQVASGVGLVAAVLGLLTGTYYLVQALTSNIAVPGYASTIIAVMVLGGVQLLALGIVGEYVGRLHLNVNRKPQYTVRRVLSGRRHADGDALDQAPQHGGATQTLPLQSAASEAAP